MFTRLFLFKYTYKLLLLIHNNYYEQFNIFDLNLSFNKLISLYSNYDYLVNINYNIGCCCIKVKSKVKSLIVNIIII